MLWATSICLTLKRLGHYKCNIAVWNWSNAMDICSALWILMAWCFSTRASATTVLGMHLCLSGCLWVNDSTYPLLPIMGFELLKWLQICPNGPSDHIRGTFNCSTGRVTMYAQCKIDQSVLIINSSWPSDAIWQQRSGSTLAQVMACCLTAPSHYLNQCWLIISKVHWHSYLGQFHKRRLNHQSLTFVWQLHV